MLEIETLHHVSLPATDLARSAAFYTGVLGLVPIERPPFDFEGAWYRVGDRTLHLIVPTAGEDPTLRRGKGIDSHDAHCAIRVRSFSRAVAYLESQGYRAAAERNAGPTAANPKPMHINRTGRAGFPQIYILDPDRNVIEINAAVAD